MTSDLGPCVCALCDAKASGRVLEIRTEVRCLNCGHYSILHVAIRALDELSGAGRAIATDALRAQVKAMHAHTEVPLIAESDVAASANRLP